MSSTLLLLPFSAPYPPYYKDDALKADYRLVRVLLLDAVQDPSLMRAKLPDILPVHFKLWVKQLTRQSDGKSVPEAVDIDKYYNDFLETARSKGASDLAVSIRFAYRILVKNLDGVVQEQKEERNETVVKFLGMIEFREISILANQLLPDGADYISLLKNVMIIELGVILLDDISSLNTEINEASLEDMAILVNESAREFGMLAKRLGFSKKRGSGRPLEFRPVSDQDILDQKAWAEAGLEDYVNSLN